jgi:hypothetical protein
MYRLNVLPEGIEYFCFEPKHTIGPTANITLFSRSIFLPSTRLAFARALGAGGDRVLYGKCDWKLSPGSRRLGVPEEADTDMLTASEVLEIAKVRWGFNSGDLEELTEFVKQCESYTPPTTLEARELDLFKALCDHAMECSCIPGLLDQQMDVYSSDLLPELDEYTSVRFQRIYRILTKQDKISLNVFLPEGFIKAIASKPELCSGSRAIAEWKTLLFAKFLSAFSTTSLFNKVMRCNDYKELVKVLEIKGIF